MNNVTLALWDAHIRAQEHLDPFTPIYFRPGARLPAPVPPARWRRWLHYSASLLFAARLVAWRWERHTRAAQVRMRFYLQNGVMQAARFLDAALRLPYDI